MFILQLEKRVCGRSGVWVFFMVLSQRSTQIQLSMTWNSVAELKPRKSTYPWHRGWTPSWENDFLIALSALPEKGFKLVSRNLSKDTGIWMPWGKRESIYSKEGMSYYRLLKHLQLPSQSNLWNNPIQTHLCRLLGVTQGLEELGAFCWYARKKSS